MGTRLALDSFPASGESHEANMVAHVVPGLGDNGSTLLLCHEGDYKSCLATKSTGRSKGIDFAPLGGGAAPYSPRQPSTVVFSPVSTLHAGRLGQVL